MKYWLNKKHWDTFLKKLGYTAITSNENITRFYKTSNIKIKLHFLPEENLFNIKGKKFSINLYMSDHHVVIFSESAKTLSLKNGIKQIKDVFRVIANPNNVPFLVNYPWAGPIVTHLLNSE
jgi:hypothetical protein